MVRLQNKQQKAYRRQYYQLNRGKALEQGTENYVQKAPIKKAAMKEKYASNPEPKRAAARSRYASNPEPKRAAVRGRYVCNPEPKRAAARGRYASNPEPERAAARDRYVSNPEPKRAAVRGRYASNPEPERAAARDRCASNPEPKKTAASKRYAKYRSVISKRLRTRYYSSIVHKRAARLLQHARNRFRENAKNKAYRQRNMQSILLARRSRYVLFEPKMDVKQMYVESLQRCIHSKADLKKKLLHAFKSSCNVLGNKVKASKLHLSRAVSSISSRKLLNRVLKVRKQSVGTLLQCIRSVNALEITSASNFGSSRHTASSEPFFYYQCYQKVNHPSPIVVDSNGRCVILLRKKGREMLKQKGLPPGNVLLSVNNQPQRKRSVFYGSKSSLISLYKH